MLRSEALPCAPAGDAPPTALDNYLFLLDGVTGSGDMLSGRRVWFRGQHVSFSIGKPDSPTDGFYRNAWSDELVVVTQGSGVLRSPFGELRSRSSEDRRFVAPRRVDPDYPYRGQRY